MRNLVLLLFIIVSAPAFAVDPRPFYFVGPLGVAFNNDGYHSAICAQLLGQFSEGPLLLSSLGHSYSEFLLGEGSHVHSLKKSSSISYSRIITAYKNEKDLIEADVYRGSGTFERIENSHRLMRRDTLIMAGATEEQMEAVEASEAFIPREAISFLLVGDIRTRRTIGILRVVSIRMTSQDPPALPVLLYLKRSDFLNREDWNKILENSYSHTPTAEAPVQAIELGMLYVADSVSPKLAQEIWQTSFNWFAQFEPALGPQESVVFGHAIAPRTKRLYSSKRYGQMKEVFHFERKDENGLVDEYHSILTKPTEEFIDATKDKDVVRYRP